jgi:hypothetical protein
VEVSTGVADTVPTATTATTATARRLFLKIAMANDVRKRASSSF